RPVVRMHEGGACDEPRYPRVPEQHPAEIVIDRVDAEPFGRDLLQWCTGADHLLDPLSIVPQWTSRPQEEDVKRSTKPHMDVGIDLVQAAHDSGQHGQRHLVELYPLTEHAVIREPPLRDPKELRRVQRGDAGDPRIRWL